MSEPPDIEIGASARIRRLRFEDEPDTEVRYRGDYQAETLHQRENLPDEVEPGETYRDVWVSWHTKVRLDVEPEEPSG
ncbi:MAG TPA: hypothetical protein VEX39_12150 [Thermoleophilaceae bacterium]|nr:hypothetical protein [Thermoleophilaceae bacterium]